MTAAELIEKIITRYRDAEHYEDRGTVLVLVETATQANFQTSFDRPDKLSFSLDVHYADDDEEVKDAYRIERDAGLMRFEPEERGGGIHTLDLALAALTGVSFSAAHIVPKLLMPDVVSGRQLFELGCEHAPRADVSIDGEPHAVIEMRNGDAVHRVYAAQRTSVIRRLELVSREDAAQHHHPAAGRFVWRIDYRATLR